MNNAITSIHGVRAGQASSPLRKTGCTVLLFDKPAITAVEARGGWPGTFDTDSIGFGKTFYKKHAIFLTGGDVFGLECSAGIQKYLVEKKFASDRKAAFLPGVVGATIYDLNFGREVSKTDYSRLGYLACKNATDDPVKQGNIGAGLGATVGKLRGLKHSMKGAVGSSVTNLPFNIKVGALVVTNAVGNVFESGITIAGTRKSASDGKTPFLELEETMSDYMGERFLSSRSKATTIGVVVTDLELSHEEVLKVCEMAHDGLARCVRPSHTTTDGDTLFCASTAQRPVEISSDLLDLVGHMAALEVQKSVLFSVRNAKSLNGIPAINA